jgi:hypothetical protein
MKVRLSLSAPEAQLLSIARRAFRHVIPNNAPVIALDDDEEDAALTGALTRNEIERRASNARETELYVRQMEDVEVRCAFRCGIANDIY